jgi:hypothetical protein
LQSFTIVSGIICDCLRICFREKHYFASDLNSNILDEILIVGERNIKIDTNSRHHHDIIKTNDDHVSYFFDSDEIFQVSFRCLTNALNRESNHDDTYTEVFLNKPLNGLLRIFNILKSVIQTVVLLFKNYGNNEEFIAQTNRKCENLYFIIRLLYMLVTQR